MKKGFRGFTLIELLVVIAIIGLLSTIIAAPIQNARKKARDAKKIAELKAVQLALEQYAESNNGAYPMSMSLLSPAYMPVLPTFASSTTSSARDAYPYAFYIGQVTGATDQIFAFHLGAKLEVYGPALETDRDCIGAFVGTSLNPPACVVYNGTAITVTRDDNGSQITLETSGLGTSVTAVATGTPAGVAGDFDGAKGGVATAENPSGSCVGNNSCIFDITSQQ